MPWVELQVLRYVLLVAALDRKEGKLIDPEAVPGVQRVYGFGGSEYGYWADVLEKGNRDRPSIHCVPVVSSTGQTLMSPAHWL